MLRTSVRSCLSVIALSMLCSSAALAEKVKNPEYEMWSKFKAGAMSKVEGKTVAAGTESKQTITTKLVEITADKAVIEMVIEMDAMGNKMAMPAQKREIPATIDAPAGAPATPAAPPADAKTSEETVDVAGKSLKTKVVEATSESNGMKVHSKTWTCDEVPGGLVKSEAHTTGAMESKSEMTLVEFTTGA